MFYSRPILFLKMLRQFSSMISRSLFVGFFLATTLAFSVRAETEAARLPMENRFLFVVDISSAMTRSAKAAQIAVLDLIRSGMQGQMRDGDTFGIWTYNDKLHADFSMQTWSAQTSEDLADYSAKYLRSRRYEKKARLEKVLPAIFPLMRASRTITIALVSDGTGVIKGTPFDKDINDLHKEYGRELHEANLPFITILAARDGEIFDYTINSSIGPIRIPQTAAPLKKAATNLVSTMATNVVAPAKIAVTNLASPKPEAPPRRIILIRPKTNAVSVAAPVIATNVFTPVPQPKPEPVAPVAASVAPTPPVEVKNVPVTPPVPIPIPTVAPAAPKIEPPKIQPVAVEIAKVETPPAQTLAQIPIPKTKPVPAPAATATPAAVSPAPESKVPIPIAESRLAVSPQPTQVAPKTEVKTPANTNAQIAVVMLSPISTWILLLAAVMLLGIACVLLIFILRRLRPAPQPSIISQSIDRSK